MTPNFSLIQKYNKPGPRYTSYPTAVQFQEIGETHAIEVELKERWKSPKALSLYFHIPFCFSLCWYCGCTKIITKDKDRGDIYLDYLEKEMDLIRPLLNTDSPVIQVHFGGGTPTFLRPDQLYRLGRAIHSRFILSDDVEFSVEIDPRTCSEEQIEALSEMGCNRASLGIQDTSPQVQKAVHRIQPYEQVVEVIQNLRRHGIQAINFDLIYGLPRQTPDSFRKTIEDVTVLDPNRFAVYSYAHIPSLMPAQKLLKEEEFPSTADKLKMLGYVVETLPQQGYTFIGMDHFAKEDDELSLALQNGTLQRNFQGYSTRADADMIAFGMSGISQAGSVYFQNTKDLGNYYRYLDRGRLPIVKQLFLSREDEVRRDLIMKIMCQTELNFESFSAKWKIDFETDYREELNRLAELEADGLVVRTKEKLMPTEKGRLFLRNIAMVFDAYLKKPEHEARYSKTV